MNSPDGGPEAVWRTVFADGPGGGNPCPIILDADGLNTEQMQAQAAEFGVETVFVQAAIDGGDALLRYFVPRHEMQMCVHATVAATLVLAETGALAQSPALIETELGTLTVSWDGAQSSAVVSQFAPIVGNPIVGRQRADVLAALGLEAGDLDERVGPICSVSTARAKLMVPVREEEILDGLEPDFERLWSVCDDLAVTGFYPFTVSARGADATARQFPRRSGYAEDPATGVAACGLGAYLSTFAGPGWVGWQDWDIAQGRALGRPSLITAHARRDDSGRVIETAVGGQSRAMTGDESRTF